MCNKITTLPGEIWFDIPGYEGFYQLSNMDRLKSVARMVKIKNGGLRRNFEKIKEFTKDLDSGYMAASLWREGKGKVYYLHQLKLLVFVGPCPVGMECRHLDGDGGNNDITNLAWGTHNENIQDKRRHGTTVKGRLGNSYKLKGRELEILEMFETGSYSIGDLAKFLGVSKQAVYGCLERAEKKRRLLSNGSAILH